MGSGKDTSEAVTDQAPGRDAAQGEHAPAGLHTGGVRARPLSRDVLVRTGGISNAAVAAVLARNGGTPGATADPPAKAPSPLALVAALVPVFESAALGGSLAELTEQLTEWTIATLSVPADARAEVKRRSREIGALQGAGPPPETRLYDIPQALTALAKLHAASGSVDGFEASLGVQHVAKLMARDSAGYLAEAMSPPTPTAAPPLELERWLDAVVDSLSDGSALLMLELEGTIAKLMEVRGAFDFSTDRAERKAHGAEIGVLARRAVLLDEAARQARGPSAAPLMDTVERSLATIGAASRDSATESSALGALGDRLELLADRTIDLSASPAGDMPARTGIDPEEAFPEATDRADERFMGSLAGRMENQASEVQKLRANVVPTSFELPDFAAVHRRWWAFYSQQQEKLDVVGSLAWKLYEDFYEKLLGMDTGDVSVSLQQGVGRALLMPGIVEAVQGGFARDFGAQLDAGAPQRSERTVGSASSPEYQFAEMVDAGTGRTQEDERTSRSRLSGGMRSRTASAMTTVAAVDDPMKPAFARGLGMAPDASVPIAGARPTTPEQGWSYLVDVRDERDFDPDPPLAMREHKVVPPEIVEYLLARRQQIATLQDEHTAKAPTGQTLGGPRIPGSSGGALERGTGMAREMYVEGESSMENGKLALDPTARRLQAARGAGLAETGAEPGGGGDPAQRALTLLRAELEGYMDRWLIDNRGMEYRVAAVIAIASTEHGIKESFKQFLELKEFTVMVGKAIGIAAGLALLGAFGTVGRVASMAIGAWLRSQGVSDITAMISIGAFLKQAGDASGFHEARGWALIGKGVANDLASVMENVVTSPLTDAIGRIGKSPPKSTREVADTIRPLTDADPKLKREVLAEVDRQIAEFDAEHGEVSHPDREALVALRDGIEGRSSFEGGLGADAPLRADQPPPKGIEVLTGPRQRGEAEWKALRVAIGDPNVPVIENPELKGTTVQVRYDEHGFTIVEIGPEASPRHVADHAGTVRELRSYEGVVGQLRLLLSRILTALRVTQGFGTEGFEARAEVRKLRKIQEHLQAREEALAKRLDRISEDPANARRELDAIKRELQGVEAQLKGWEARVDSYEPGRGIIAAVDTRGSQAPPEFAIQQVTPTRVPNPTGRGRVWAGFPDTVPKNTVLEFPDGSRVWRTDEGVAIESALGPGPGRADYERAYPARGEYADPGFQAALYELAHSQGQGTGHESPYAIKLAPSEVNQRLQRHGIEEYLYRLRDQHPGAEFHIVTNTVGVPRSRRLQQIEYTIWVTQDGRRHRLFELGITVEGTIGQPNIDVDITYVNTDDRFKRYIEGIDMEDVHERFAAIDLSG